MLSLYLEVTMIPMQTEVFKEVGGHYLYGIIYRHLQIVDESIPPCPAIDLIHSFRYRIAVGTAFMPECRIIGRYQVI